MVTVSDRLWSTDYLISNCQAVYRKTDENVILVGTSELHKQTSTSCFLSTMYGYVFSTDTHCLFRKSYDFIVVIVVYHLDNVD